MIESLSLKCIFSIEKPVIIVEKNGGKIGGKIKTRLRANEKLKQVIDELLHNSCQKCDIVMTTAGN